MAMPTLPTDPAERKRIPLYSGLFRYFPHALCAVARNSQRGNDQHHPGTPLHWDMDKSTDELDAMLRHVIDEDWAAVAWRALANLERKLTGQCQYEGSDDGEEKGKEAASEEFQEGQTIKSESIQSAWTQVWTTQDAQGRDRD